MYQNDKYSHHKTLHSHVGKSIPKEKMTKHHVPPSNPDPVPKPRILMKSEKHHQAYHLLFGAARSFDDAAEILRRDWWELKDDKGNKF